MTNLWLSCNNLWWSVEFLFDWSCIVMRAEMVTWADVFTVLRYQDDGFMMRYYWVYRDQGESEGGSTKLKFHICADQSRILSVHNSYSIIKSRQRKWCIHFTSLPVLAGQEQENWHHVCKISISFTAKYGFSLLLILLGMYQCDTGSHDTHEARCSRQDKQI